MNEFSFADGSLDISWIKVDNNFVYQATWGDDSAESICSNISLAFDKLSLSEDDLNIESESLWGCDDE